MSVITFEGVVEDGQIRLKPDVRLPDKTRVYVLVPDVQVEPAGHIFSPRLARPEEAVDFALEVTTDGADARL